MKQNSYTSVQRSNNGISRVRLNDPNTYNSMSFNMLNSLIAALKDLDKDKKTTYGIIGVKVWIFRGEINQSEKTN